LWRREVQGFLQSAPIFFRLSRSMQIGTPPGLWGHQKRRALRSLTWKKLSRVTNLENWPLGIKGSLSSLADRTSSTTLSSIRPEAFAHPKHPSSSNTRSTTTRHSRTPNVHLSLLLHLPQLSSCTAGPTLEEVFQDCGPFRGLLYEFSR
jgi:hypothetical protein